MAMIKAFTLLLALHLITLVEIFAKLADCPHPDLLKPCDCNGKGYVACSNTNVTSTQLKDIFINLAKNLTKDEKHFTKFHISEELVINEIKDNTFQDITFDEIEIMFNKNLTKVGKNAFNGTDSVTWVISFAYNYKLTDLSLYETVSKFKNATNINFYDNGITTIPTNAFGNNSIIKTLKIGGKYLVKIEAGAFENLSNLLSVDIFNSSISYIPEKAFLFANESTDKDNRIYLGFPDNILLTGNSFADNCFSHCDRTIELGLNTLSEDRKMGKITFLKENVFRPFFEHNTGNVVTVVGLPIDCNDCRNYWLTKEPLFQKRMAALQCADGSDFNNSTNFKKCAS